MKQISKVLVITSIMLNYLPALNAQVPITKLNLEKYTNKCKQQVLTELGWKFAENTTNSDSGKISNVESPTMCTSKNLNELTAQLKINLKNADSEKTIFDQALKSVGTACIFQHQYANALDQSLGKLTKNKLHIFTPFWYNDNSPNMSLWKLKSDWQSIPCDNDVCYAPKEGNNSQAIDSLYKNMFQTDCALGLQLAEYTAIKELFGQKEFDKSFSTKELMVGEWDIIHESESITHGQIASEIDPPDIIAYAKAGYTSLAGVSGYLGSVYSEEFLDNLSNRGENFLVKSTTPEAMKSIIQHGGLDSMNALVDEIWKLSKLVSREELYALQNIAADSKQWAKITDIMIQEKLPKESGLLVSGNTMKLVSLVSEPFLSQTQIYVHPVGVKTFTWHLLRLAQLNPRTPYSVVFYADAVHNGIFDRWLKSQLDACSNK